jgi:hypothetical protein
VYAGDWILDLLGATMVVGSGMMLLGGSALVFALMRVASSGDGLARARSFPSPGVANHAEEVRGRIRSRYMQRAGLIPDAAASKYVAFEIEAADPIAVLIAQGATTPITKLPPLNESLRRGLAARAIPAVEPNERTAPQRRRTTRRKAKPAKSRARSKTRLQT